MSFESYKKRLNLSGGSESGERLKSTEEILLREFKNDLSYKDILVNGENLDIGVRIVNKDKPSLKSMYVPVESSIKEGDYVTLSFDENVEKTFIVGTIERNLISRCLNVEECNQTIVLKNGKKYHCVSENDSYGSKISANNDLKVEIDTKMKITIQLNAETKSNIDLGDRFIFNNSKYDIFRVTDINTSIKQGLITIITEKDEYIPNLDNLETNTAWNGERKPTVEIANCKIKGNNLIVVNHEEKFVIDPPTSGVELSISNQYEDEDIIEIVERTDDYIIIKALKPNKFITIELKVNGTEIIDQMSVLTSMY